MALKKCTFALELYICKVKMKYTVLFLIFFSLFERSVLAQEIFNSQQTEADTSIIEQLDALMSTWYAKKMNYHENSQLPVANQEPDYSTVDSLMIHRLKILTDKTLFPMVFNEDIRAYINMYIKRKQSVSVMLGLAKYYFPFFEETLDKYNCPLELKYLAVIESASIDSGASTNTGCKSPFRLAPGSGWRKSRQAPRQCGQHVRFSDAAWTSRRFSPPATRWPLPRES